MQYALDTARNRGSVEAVLKDALVRLGVLPSRCRSPYAKRLFEAGIRLEFQYHRYRKLATLSRLIVDEWRYRRADTGMFLCATATRLA